MIARSAPQTPAPAAPRLLLAEPVLPVQDVQAITAYYRDVLGFDDVWTWGDPPSHGGASRDGVQVQFSLNPSLAADAEGRGVWFRVQNVAALYAVHQQRGAEIVEPLEPKPWGVSQYGVRDLNGYTLRFGGPGAGTSASAGLPAGVLVESRLPSRSEMEALAQAVGWDHHADSESAPRVLTAARFAAVATVGGQVIGCAFVTSDNAGFYYVRDVLVHPDWQRRRVGTALVERLMEVLRAEAPDGSLVGLFTGDHLHDYYARFGFRGPASGLHGMTLIIRR